MENLETITENEAKPMLAEVMAGYKETLKARLKNSIEEQQQQNMTKYNEGREDAFKYALEMLDKHFC